VKVYSYYDNVGFKNQTEIVNLWMRDWSNKGFEPVLLSINSIEDKEFLRHFYNEITDLHIYITGKPINKYGLSCYFRWIAYSSINQHEPFLATDYDIFNVTFNEQDMPSSLDKMRFLNRYCPCAVFATAAKSLEFAQDIISISRKNKIEIRDKYRASGFIHYHDQEFLALNADYLNDRYFFEKPREKIKLFTPNFGKENTKMVHFAHRSAKEFAEKIKLFNFDQEKLRIEMIKSFIF
jgi:hypothetical protein